MRAREVADTITKKPTSGMNDMFEGIIEILMSFMLTHTKRAKYYSCDHPMEINLKTKMR